MWILRQKEKKRPFSLLFQQLSPKEFVFKLRNEYLQTITFLLFYAPGAYRRKVIRLIKDEDSRKILVESLHNLKSRQITPSVEFISEIEKASLEYLYKEH